MNTLAQLQTAAGAADVAVSAWEREHGCQPKPGPDMKAYNDLLRASAEAKAALRCEMARVTGRYEWSLFAKQT